MIKRYFVQLTIVGIIISLIGLSYASSLIYYMLSGYGAGNANPASVWLELLTYGFNDTMFLALSLPVIAVIASLVWFFNRPRPIYGDARWARMHEIRKASMFDEKGIILGKKHGKYLINNEDGHVLVSAPTGSGKGVGLVIPNLLSWRGSVIALDVKKENFRITSGFKAKYSAGGVYMFSPRSEETHCFNPLDTVRRDSQYKISDIRDLAYILIPKDSGGEHSMWETEARDLFEGLALYVIDSENTQATFGEIYRMVTSDVHITDLLKFILQHETLDPACRGAFNNYVTKADKERSGVKSHLTGRLNIWKEPNIDAATSKSDFRIEDFRKKKTALYIGFALSDLESLAPLVNMICQLTIQVLTRHIPTKDEPHELLMLIDEMPALGRMDKLKGAISTVREYNIRIMNIIQGLSQLDDIYKKEGRDLIMQNSKIQVYFATNDEVTTNSVSKRLGTTTIKTTTRNQNRSLKLYDPGSHAHSVNKRDFMLPQEIQTFHKKKMIILKENTRPIEATKITYYDDPTFKSRLFDPVTLPKNIISKAATNPIIQKVAIIKKQSKSIKGVSEAEKRRKRTQELVEVTYTQESSQEA